MNCTKDYQITIAGTPLTDYVWWKMEEATGANRVDSIQGKILAPVVSGTSAVNRVAGKIDFAAELAVNPLEQAFLTQTPGTGILYTNGVGMTLCGWFQYDSLDDTVMTWGIANPVQNYQVIAANFLGGFSIASNAGSTAVATPSAGVWHFFILEYVPGVGVRWEVDRNGVFFVQGGSEFGTGANMTASFEADGTFSLGSVNWKFDEIGMIPFILTSPQKDYLYNGGAGRTSPITLP